MSKSVQLPFFVPVFCSSPGMSAAALVMQKRPTAYNQILNQCATVACHRDFLRGYSSPRVGIPRLGIASFSCLEKYNYSLKYMSSTYKDTVKQMLDDGLYVLFDGFDDYYLPGKCWYGIRHMSHDGIFCGYDDNDMTFSIICYDINWIYKVVRIQQSYFDEALASAFDMGSFGYMIGYRMKDEEIGIDKNSILKYLKEHTYSTLENYPPEEDGVVRGIAVYDYLNMYIDKLKDGSIPSEKMDWRSMRPVWEHKKCMYDRLYAVEESEQWDHSISDEYKPLIEIADHIRGAYAMYHKVNNARFLNVVSQGLVELRDKEYDILHKFIKKLESQS